jgi:hypothetical protein
MSVTIENWGATAIRPFTLPRVPEAELEALRARIADTPLPFAALARTTSCLPKRAATTPSTTTPRRRLSPSRSSLADRTSRCAALE